VPPDSELPPELAKHDPKLIEQVCNEVIDASGRVAWEDIAGLETAKHLIKEIVVWPMLNPQIFTVSGCVCRQWGRRGVYACCLLCADEQLQCGVAHAQPADLHG
jgi:SpoVK/Ycf46/Vps4 family AAA+-type ATPase